MNLRTLGALCALLTLGAVLPLTASAQKPPMDNKMGGKMGKMDMMAKKPMKGNVYLCKECKAYFMEAAAKKMGYKDKMGHKLMKAKAAMIPAGYKDGAKMGMSGDKMGKMDKMGGKMSGDKM